MSDALLMVVICGVLILSLGIDVAMLLDYVRRSLEK
jgi:hypothetical protein